MEISQLVRQEVQLESSMMDYKGSGSFNHKVVEYRAALLRTRRAIHHHYHPRYTLAPLVWVPTGLGMPLPLLDNQERHWTAVCVFGTIQLVKAGLGKYYFIGKPLFHGLPGSPFDSFKAAADYAWHCYQKALLPALQPQHFDEQSAPLLTITDHLHNAAHLGFEWAAEALASVEAGRKSLLARSLRMALVGAFEWGQNTARWAAAFEQCPIDWAETFEIDVRQVPKRTTNAIEKEFDFIARKTHPDTGHLVALTLQKWQLLPLLKQYPKLQFKISISE